MSEESNNPVGTAFDAAQEVQQQAVQNKPKKKGGGALIVIILLLAAAGFAVYYFFFFFKPAFEVNGEKFNLSSTIEELEQKGLVLMTQNNQIYTPSGTIPGSSILNTTYRLGVKDGNSAKYTGLVIQIGNFNKEAKPYGKCSIYMIYYYPESQDPSVTVKVCEQDFSKVTMDNVKQLTLDSKIPFKDGDFDNFLSGKSTLILGSNNSYKWEISKTNGPFVLEFKRNVDLKINGK